MTAATSTPARPPRNVVGIVALVLALLTMIAPLVVWIVLGIAGATLANTVDDAIYVDLLGGMVVFFGAIATARVGEIIPGL